MRNPASQTVMAVNERTDFMQDAVLLARARGGRNNDGNKHQAIVTTRLPSSGRQRLRRYQPTNLPSDIFP
jgi:hypothetical protein